MGRNIILLSLRFRLSSDVRQLGANQLSALELDFLQTDREVLFLTCTYTNLSLSNI